MHELKKIVLEFIEQIKNLDFEKETDIKLLYEKANDIETQITNVDYNGNSASAERFFEVTEKLNYKIPDIIIVRIPKFRAITSGAMSYEDVFGKFQMWQEAHNDFFQPIIFDAPDFLCENNGNLEWIWRIKDEITEADVSPYKIIEHQGGLYAAAVSIDGDDESGNKVLQKIEKWIEKTNFVIDNSRTTSVHMIYVILKFHKGNKQYPQPADSQMEFDTLDSPISKIRIILLVQIGKEGWDCRSLTGIILSQEGDCPKNMVLQTSCRCLRQVEKDMPETALIYLNEFNAEKLNSQLMQQQHISIKEFSSAKNDKIALKRYNRTEYLKLPKIDYYQLKIKYDTVVTESEIDTSEQIKSSLNNNKIESVIRTTDLSMETIKIDVVSEERGNVPATFLSWLYGIAKESFGFLTMAQFNEHISALREVFNRSQVRLLSGAPNKTNPNFSKSSDLFVFYPNKPVFGLVLMY